MVRSARVRPLIVDRGATARGRRPLAVCTLAGITAWSSAVHAQPLFDARFASYPTGSAPRTASVADLDRDGHQDLIVVNATNYSSPGSISVLHGRGDGTFRDRVDYSTGVHPVMAALGDLNVDGDPDLVAVNSTSGTISVLLGTPSGGFGPTRDFPAGAGSNALALADIDRDGSLDVITANYAATTVAFLRGLGDGTFAAPVPCDIAASPYHLTVADVNSDGLLDVLTANLDAGDVSILLGDGRGGFPVIRRLAPGYSPIFVLVRELTDDGIVDLFVGNYQGDVARIFRGDGFGNFTAHSTLQPASGFWCDVGDLNEDGRQDLAFVFQIYLGVGGGTFMYSGSFIPEGQTLGCVLADLDEDGHEDLIMPNNETASVSVSLGNGDGTFGRWIDYPTGPSPKDIVTGDWNGDHAPDLAIVNEASGSLTVWLGNGDGTMHDRADYPVGQTYGSGPNSVDAADVNGDSHPDVVLANAGLDAVQVLLGNGDGTFLPARSYPTASHPTDVATGDLDADGDIDIVTASFRSTLSILLGNGDGTFGPPIERSRGTPGCCQYIDEDLPGAVAVARLDSNPLPDIISTQLGYCCAWGGYDQTECICFVPHLVGVLLASGPAQYAPEQEYGVQVASVAVRAGDMNADGAIDVVVTGLDERGSILLGDGTGGSFFSGSAFASGRYHVIEDFDGDGALDIAGANYYARSVSVVLRDAAGGLRPRLVFGSGDTPRAVATADFDLDGRMDLAVLHEAAGTVTLLLNRVTFHPVATLPSLVEAYWSSGRVHLLWHSVLAGRLASRVLRRPAAGEWADLASTRQ